MSLQIGQEVWYIENFEIKSGVITHFKVEDLYEDYGSAISSQFIKCPVVNTRVMDEYFVYETRESAIYHLKYTLQAELNEVSKLLEKNKEEAIKLNKKLEHLDAVYATYCLETAKG